MNHNTQQSRLSVFQLTLMQTELQSSLMGFYLVRFLSNGVQGEEVVLASDAEEAAFTFLRGRPLATILSVVDYRVL